MKICPACQRNVSEADKKCQNWSVIFSNWAGTRPRTPDFSEETWLDESPAATNRDVRYRIAFRALVFLILAYYARILLICRTPTFEIFLHRVDLPFHEAGHISFSFGGKILTLMGGGFMEVFMPCLIFGHFLYRSDYLGSTGTLFWIGENLLDVS